MDAFSTFASPRSSTPSHIETLRNQRVIEPIVTLSNYIAIDSLGRRIEVTLESDRKSQPRNVIVLLEATKSINQGESMEPILDKGKYIDVYV